MCFITSCATNVYSNMPNGSFDHRLAQPFSELARESRSPEEAERLSRLRYHLESNDYFAFLATVFGILEEGLYGKKSEVAAEELAFIHSMRKDLVYLQSEYRIDPRFIEA